ncbi:unnamed protein product [Heligmosomoides polygyrus]|uniref:Uncharacterized protein n=1 Tax=Heligmosomoides polygyrus TaxID=6339 RepID=A0A183FWR4_HELPZ|nr:unnamed protein product [Heligmosomoides polygyrus]
MVRSLVALLLVALVAFATAAAVHDRALSSDSLPMQRFKRQWGFGWPMGGGGSYGNSWGYSSSQSFNMYSSGFNNGWWGKR